jgi:hypothetical protein
MENKKIHAKHLPSLWGILTLYTLIWTLSRWISDANLDGYGDMLENIAWSQNFEWGTFKHPPFFVWVVSAWFSVFPYNDFAYKLLSYTNNAIGLAGVALFCRQIVPQLNPKFPVLLLICAFPYSTLGAKFNANTILLSMWPWVAVFFMAAIKSRKPISSIGLGILAAGAMLSKYYSGVFLLGLFISSLIHRESRSWYKTYSPYVALIVFCVCLIPHFNWLKQHDFVTFHYVEEQGNGEIDFRQWINFALAPLLYWGISWILAISLNDGFKRFSFSQLWRTWLPRNNQDLLFWIGIFPWLLSLFFGLTGFVQLSLPWAIPIGFTWPILWLRNLEYHDEFQHQYQLSGDYHRLFRIVLSIVLFLGPIYAFIQAKNGSDNYYRPREEAAHIILNDWNTRHPKEILNWVGGEWQENGFIAFYGNAKIRVLPYFPDHFPATLSNYSEWKKRNGILLCALGRTMDDIPPSMLAIQRYPCIKNVETWLMLNNQPITPHIFVVNRKGWRFPLNKPFMYVVYDVLPQ